MSFKICTKCNKEKSFNNFYRDPRYINKYRSVCKSCYKIYINLDYQVNYRKLNRNKTRKYNKKYKIENKESYKNYQIKYRENNKLYFRKYAIKYQNNRNKNDLNFRLSGNLRARIRESLKHSYKSDKTESLIGCSVEQLKKHLENQFQPGMTWQNYGKWHIDHIRPCASFDLSKQEEQLKCFHFSNLQPLWATDNLSKGAKYVFAKEKLC